MLIPKTPASLRSALRVKRAAKDRAPPWLKPPMTILDGGMFSSVTSLSTIFLIHPAALRIPSSSVSRDSKSKEVISNLMEVNYEPGGEEKAGTHQEGISASFAVTYDSGLYELISPSDSNPRSTPMATHAEGKIHLTPCRLVFSSSFGATHMAKFFALSPRPWFRISQNRTWARNKDPHE